MKRRLIFVLSVLAAACIAVAASALLILKRHPVSLSAETEWAIGLYSGESPCRLSDAGPSANPVITRDHVVDMAAEYVADPFIIRDASGWYLFYEILDATTRKGVIGLSESQDGTHWRYRGVVLREAFHLSYPYVFAVDGTYYMIPESAESGSVRLYRATAFPATWKHEANLIEGHLEDSSLVRHAGLWWIFSCANWATHDELRIYYAESLLGPWLPHARNPILKADLSATRPGGRMLVTPDGIVRFAQDDRTTYGKSVRAFRVTDLTTTTYQEVLLQPDPVVSATGKGWNRHGMHQIDALEVQPGRWVAAVDGYRKHFVVRIEY